MSELFKAYTKLIEEAEHIMVDGPKSHHQEMYEIIEELVYMRYRLEEGEK